MNYRNIECSKCGKEFHCMRDQGECWCFNWIIPKNIATEIHSLYNDCLCADCLSESINERSKNNNQG